MLKNDPLTGRRWGDHGTAMAAIDYALAELPFDEVEAFLSAWRDGDAGKEWPEFYEWLRAEGR